MDITAGDNLWPLKRLSHLLGVSDRTLQRWVRSDGLPTHRQRRSTGSGRPSAMFELATVAAWLRKHTAHYRSLSPVGRQRIDAFMHEVNEGRTP